MINLTKPYKAGVRPSVLFEMDCFRLLYFLMKICVSIPMANGM